MRDGLETAEQAIYESLGLALPGAVALAGAICVMAPGRLAAASSFSAAHPWLTLAACYLAGYPVQSLSRPVDKAMLTLPRGLVWLVRKINAAAADRIVERWRRLGKGLQRGHKPEREASSADSRERVHLPHLEHAHWHTRLGLKADQRLDAFDVKNLSFSTLGADQRRLHRFRAITSLNRAMAAIAGVSLWAALYLDVRYGHANVFGLAVAAGCLALFLAFRERANMYDGLWNGIVAPQYLANTARSIGAETSHPAAVTSTTLGLSSGATPPPTLNAHACHTVQPNAHQSASRLDNGDSAHD